MKFSYNGGHVENVYIPQNEPVWTLNIKRAILSMIQGNSFFTNEEFAESQISNEVI